ncbi:hypothetical protein FNF27_02254 [Cafeteria roenbergensis]|uniref:Uncharacterized protein n=1 Tax=Cafeteria roenbergensis TaxID=33653 RepID=A0A5A8EHK5_CAFRO|nr:hypothetical protein FNF27_02254 [Cafeteria roenbergensis]
MHYSRLPSGADSPMETSHLPSASPLPSGETSKPAIVTLSRENRRALSVFMWSALLVVGSTVLLVILQAYDVGEITYPVLSYYAGYLQSGGGERKAFFGQATGPVPVPGLEAQCGSSSGIGPGSESYPAPPAGLLRRAAASRVISGLAVDDGDSVYSVTATSLTLLPGGESAAADSLGTELFLTRHGDEEESSLLAQVQLVRARPAEDRSAADLLQTGRAGRAGRPFADSSRGEAAAASREPFLALAQLGMEASSKAPLVAIRGSVLSAPTGGAASSAAPPSEAVSMLALLSADHDTGALRCVDSIDFVAAQRSASKAVPAAECVGPSSEDPGPMNDVADPEDPTWFRPVAMAVGGCVHPGSALNTTCPAAEPISRRASDLCAGQAAARDQSLPFSWVDAYVGGPRDNQMEIVRVRIVVRRSSCDARWTAVRLLQDWVVPHAAPAVPLFWPLPVAAASTVALFANASMLFASYPLLDPIGTDGAAAPAVHGHRPVPMQIIGLNTTGRLAWQLTTTLPNVTGLASNLAVDEGGSLWVVATSTVHGSANATGRDRLGTGTSHWPALHPPPRRPPPACNSSSSGAACRAHSAEAEAGGSQSGLPYETLYSLVSISPADGTLRRMDSVRQLQAKRRTPTLMGPLMQLAVSANFVTFCEQLWVGFANMTEVHGMWEQSQRLPLTAGIGWGAFSLDDGSGIGSEGQAGSGRQLACVGDMIATDKAIFATVAESAEGPWLADDAQRGGAVQLDAGWSLPSVEAERPAGSSPGPAGVQGAVLNLFAMASVTARGRVVWSSKSAASTDLLPAELGTLQFPGPWEPRADGSTMSSPAPLGPGDETWAFFGTSARVSSALGTGRRLVSQRDSPMFVHTPAVPWTNESVDTAETVQRCSSLLPPSLVEGYTFLTVGMLLSMMARCLRGWCWATVFRVHAQGAGGALPDDTSLRLVKFAPHKCMCLDCRLGQLEKHCRVRCCAVRCRQPCGLDPFVMHPHDLARHFDVLNIRTENLPPGSLRYRQGLAIVEPSLFKGHLVTRSGAKVHVRPRPTCRASCTPREVLAVQAGSGELFRAVRTAGFNACCIDCRFALDRSAMTPSRGPRTDATQWQLITMFHATLVAVILVWTTSQAAAGTAAFQAELASPATFFFEYLVNAPANPSAGCQNALEAACFCSTTHSLMRAEAPSPHGGSGQLNTAGFPMHPYEAMARLGTVRGRCPCASSNACTKACDVMLADTGNCAAQAFPYVCQCASAPGKDAPTDCSATGMEVMTTNQLPSDAPLQRGLVACSNWYSGTSALLVAASATVCLVVVGLLAAQLDTTMNGPAGKRAAHSEGKLVEPESDRSEGAGRDAAGGPAHSTSGSFGGLSGEEAHSSGRPGRKFRPRVRSSSSDSLGPRGGHRPSNSGAKWGGVRDEVIVHGGRRGASPAEQEVWDRTAGVVELGTRAPADEEDEREVARAGSSAPAASVGVAGERRRHGSHSSDSRRAAAAAASQTVRAEQTGWSHKWDTSVHGTVQSSDRSSGESSDAGVARELAEARRLEGREPAFVAARRLELQSSLLLNLPQITLKTRLARLAQRQQSSTTIDVFDHRDVEALEQHDTDDAEAGGTAATAKMEGSTLAGITLRDEEDAMVKAVARDEGSFTRFAVATVVLLSGSSLLAAAAVQLYQALAVGRHCTQEGNLADTPVATSVEASQSALLKFIPACSFSSEWRDRDPEGRVTRLGTVGFYAVAIALIVLLLDPLTMVLQLCCRLRNAWLLHPRRLAVLLSRREPMGECAFCLRVLGLPVSLLGSAVRLLLLPVTLLCCPGSRSTVGASGLPKAMWGGDVVLCCSPQWACAAWCYVPQHPCICGCGCCTAICCFEPGKRLRNRKMPAEARRRLIARKLAKQLATSTVV